MKRFDAMYHWAFVLLLCLCTLGCDKQQMETIRGLQEENKVLKKQIERLESDKAVSDAEWKSRSQLLKTDHEGSLTRVRELHRMQVSQLEKDISTLRMELGSSQRETIALREIVDREPRIKEATAARVGTDVWVLALLLLVSLVVLVVVVFRYRSASDRLNFLAMQQVGELRRIGGEI